MVLCKDGVVMFVDDLVCLDYCFCIFIIELFNEEKGDGFACDVRYFVLWVLIFIVEFTLFINDFRIYLWKLAAKVYDVFIGLVNLLIKYIVKHRNFE